MIPPDIVACLAWLASICVCIILFSNQMTAGALETQQGKPPAAPPNGSPPNIVSNRFKIQNEIVYNIARSTGSSHSSGSEDRSWVSEDKEGNQYFAVFDGHSGSQVSEFLARNTYDVVAPIVNRYVKYQCLHKVMKEKLKKAIYELDKSVVKQWPSMKGGSTLCYLVNTKDYLISINVGDSRAVMVDKNLQVFPLTDDHKPNKASELERILKMNSFVANRVYGTRLVSRFQGRLSLSRVIGDQDIKKLSGGLSSEPDVLVFAKQNGKVAINEPALIMLATDGVWDVVSDAEAIGIVLGQICPKPGAKVQPKSEPDLVEYQSIMMPKGLANLVEKARKRNSRDDITVVVASLKPKELCDMLNQTHMLKPTF